MEDSRSTELRDDWRPTVASEPSNKVPDQFGALLPPTEHK